MKRQALGSMYLATLLGATLAVLSPDLPQAHGASLYSEDFEGATTDWSTGTIVSSGGNSYFQFSGSGSYSWLGGRRTFFGNGWWSSVDVYLDPAMAGQGVFGFEVTQAITDVFDNPYRQDNLFHVGAYDTGSTYNLGITFPAHHHATAGDGNDPKYYVQQAYNNSGPLYTVNAAGWYTLKWRFTPGPGNDVNIDWVVLDDSEANLYTYSAVGANVPLSEMGGNAYMWFINSPDYYSSLSIDNVQLQQIEQTPIPEPMTLLAVGAGISALGGYVRRRRSA